MKKRTSIAIAIVAIVVAAAAAALVLRFGLPYLRRPAYNAAAPTAEKLAALARWIPAGADIVIAADVPRAFANEALRTRLTSLVQGRDGIAAELIAALVAKKDGIGMLALTGLTGAPGTTPEFAIIAQGGFDEATFIPAVRTILAAGRAGLASEAIGDKTLYRESDVRDPFGFILLDPRHLAVGSRDALAHLFAMPPAPESPAPTAAPDAVIFGRIVIGPRLAALMPAGMAPITEIDFASADGQRIAARIASPDAKQAGELRMFLEGIRSLLLLQGEANPPLVAILKGIAIAGEEQAVTVAADLLPLLDLWMQPAAAAAPAPTAPATPPTAPEASPSLAAPAAAPEAPAAAPEKPEAPATTPGAPQAAATPETPPAAPTPVAPAEPTVLAK